MCRSWHGVSVLSLFITGWLHKTGTAHLAAYLHCKSVASCRARVLLLKMHEQSVQERPLGPRSAACLKDSWKKGCPVTCRYEGEKTLAWCRPSLTTLQSVDTQENCLTQSFCHWIHLPELINEVSNVSIMASMHAGQTVKTIITIVIEGLSALVVEHSTKLPAGVWHNSTSAVVQLS